jgi:methyl-accepting chemotaxis protein
MTSLAPLPALVPTRVRSVGAKIALLTATAALINALMVIAVHAAFQRFTAQSAAVVTAAQALRHLGTTDMMHDALRGDVLAALLAGHRKLPQEAALARKERAEHEKEMRTAVGALTELQLSPALRGQVAALAGPIDAYVSAARRQTEIAADSISTAEAEMADFLARFSALESSLGALSEKLEEEAGRINAEAAAAAETFTQRLWWAAGTALVGLMAFGYAVSRSIPKPFRAIIARLGDAVLHQVESSRTISRSSSLKSGIGVPPASQRRRVRALTPRSSAN